MTPLHPTSQSSSLINRLKGLAKAFYFSNLMISIAAAAQCWLAWRFIPKTSLLPLLPCLFLFFGTFCFYGLHDFFTKVLHTVPGITSQRGSYWLLNYKWLIPLVALGLVLLPVLAWKAISLLQLSIFLLSGLLAITYSFPIIPFSPIKRWKEHGQLKIVILSGVWTGITLLIRLPGYM